MGSHHLYALIASWHFSTSPSYEKPWPTTSAASHPTKTEPEKSTNQTAGLTPEYVQSQSQGASTLNLTQMHKVNFQYYFYTELSI